MDTVIQAVERIRSHSGAQIDSNYLQGTEAVLRQAQIRSGEHEDWSFAEKLIAESQDSLAQLRDRVRPYRLPADYEFFLEFYGGLLVKTAAYNLLVKGIGPMVLEWYDFILSDDEAIFENGFLSFSDLALKKERTGQYVGFFLDLGGYVQPDCVIAIPFGPQVGYEIAPILQNPHAHRNRWTQLAGSFAGWLEQIATTGGALGYI